MKLTIRIERADGQFTVAVTDIPDVPPVSPLEEAVLHDKILIGFQQAHQRCADLPS